MPRKEFLRDLADVAVPGRFSCISDIRTGEYDGSISFTFAAPGANLTLNLQAIVSGRKDSQITVSLALQSFADA